MEIEEELPIGIIGGGITGQLTALFVSLANPFRDITIFENNNLLGEGASKAFFRLHMGAEYALDPKTGKDCLHGAALWKLIFNQPGLFTEEGSMHFMLANATHEAGLKGQPGTLTLEQYKNYYNEIKLEYKNLIEEIAIFHKNIPRSEAIRLVTEQLFGDLEYFMREMSEEDLRFYGGHVKGGFETREPGIYLHKLMSALENAITQRGNILTLTNKTVKSAKQNKSGYEIFCSDGTSYLTSQVVQSAWSGGFEIDGPLRSPEQQKKVNVYRRAMAMVDTSKIPHHMLPPPSFVLKDENGGMFSPINDNLAIVYHPGVAHLDEIELDSSNPEKRSVPNEWNEELSSEDKEKLLEKYKTALVNGPFPILEYADFKDLIIRPTLNFQKSRDQRWHEKLEEIRPGYHIIFATKGTLAVKAAIEAAEAVKTRAVMNKLGIHSLMPPPSEDLALRAIFSCSEYIAVSQLTKFADPKQFLRYARAHNDPISVLPNTAERAAFERITPKFVNDYTAELLARSLEDSKNSTSRRAFGIGFGPGCKVTVYENANPKTGPVLDPTNAKNNKLLCSKVADWINNPTDTRSLIEIIPLQAVSNALVNRLLHADMVNLITEMEQVQAVLSNDAVSTLFGKSNIKGFPRELWDRMRQKRSELPPYRTMIFQQEKDPYLLTHNIEISAVMLPFLFMQLPSEEKILAAVEIVKSMSYLNIDKSFFAKLAIEDLNTPILRKSDSPLHSDSISNTGRAIKINLQSPDNLKEVGLAIVFQGEEYYPVEFHFHRAKNIEKRPDGSINLEQIKNVDGDPDGMLEFAVYKDQKHAERCILKREEDPNREAIGELHAIFMHKNANGQRRALALCAHVKLGEENQGLAPYIKELSALPGPLGKDKPIQLKETNFDPLQCFNHGGFTDGKPLPEAPFVSLALGGISIKADGYLELSEGSSDIFYRGVNAVHLPDDASVTISLQQLEALERAQPVLETMSPLTNVLPIQRSTGTGERYK